jgi:hypothetical protein
VQQSKRSCPNRYHAACIASCPAMEAMICLVDFTI